MQVGEAAHLWVVSLDAHAGDRAIDRILDDEEIRRARMFSRAELGRRYVVRRAALRILLGAALGMEPQSVPLEVGPFGKPQLACPSELSFNVSHSGGTAVIGLTACGAIGVDVESAATVRAPKRLAERFFHPSEAGPISDLPPHHAASAFLRCWTVKEAVLKALGVGLTRSLRDVVVSSEPWLPLRLRQVPGGRSPSDWSVHELGLLGRQLHVAVAVAAPDAPVAGVHRLDPSRRL